MPDKFPSSVPGLPPLCFECDRLRAENARLRARVKGVTSDGIDVPALVLALGVSGFQAIVLQGLLSARNVLTHDEIWWLLWGRNKKDPDYENANGTIKVTLWRLRKALSVTGCEIVSHWGKGYAIDADNREILAGWQAKHVKPEVSG